MSFETCIACFLKKKKLYSCLGINSTRQLNWHLAHIKNSGLGFVLPNSEDNSDGFEGPDLCEPIVRNKFTNYRLIAINGDLIWIKSVLIGLSLSPSSNFSTGSKFDHHCWSQLQRSSQQILGRSFSQKTHVTLKSKFSAGKGGDGEWVKGLIGKPLPITI